ncbi:hypothetical protein FF021_03385 [Leptospira noguchii]|nr:hypothetical protein FF021_03385 [Leptospira noguchii]
MQSSQIEIIDSINILELLKNEFSTYFYFMRTVNLSSYLNLYYEIFNNSINNLVYKTFLNKKQDLSITLVTEIINIRKN